MPGAPDGPWVERPQAARGRFQTLPQRGEQKFPEHSLNLREGLRGPETRACSGHVSSALTSASEHPSPVPGMEATGF